MTRARVDRDGSTRSATASLTCDPDPAATRLRRRDWLNRFVAFSPAASKLKGGTEDSCKLHTPRANSAVLRDAPRSRASVDLLRQLFGVPGKVQRIMV